MFSLLLLLGGIGMFSTGCTSGPTEPVPPVPSLTTVSPLNPDQFSPAPQGAPDDDNQNGAPRAASSPEPVWDAAARRNVLGRADKVMALFARRGVSAEQWWNSLAPYLSPQAQQDYLGTDPAQVPVHRITGRPRLVEPDSTRIARVHVPTDAGLYLVLMSRTPENPTWKVEQITPPENAGD